MRIQNGSNNILLDNIESTASTPIVYTRRSRFLDDELDETKDVITSSHCDSTDASMVMPLGQSPLIVHQAIAVNNTTDLENAVASSTISKKNDLFLSTATQSTNENSLIDHIGTVRHHNRLDKIDNETVLCSNVTKTSTQSAELEMQESAFLRRQQLTRVAEWVQNNQLENNEPISSQSSMDAASIDSGYKTKVNNNCIDATTILMPSDGENCRNHHNDNGNIASDHSLSDGIKQLESNFAQLNNNLISLNGTDRLSGVNVTGGTPLSVSGGCIHKNQNAQLDLAQMEYNVKQFLLKQNEWSNNKKTAGGDSGGSDCADKLIEENAGNLGTDLASDLTLTNKNPHRTETNL